MLIAVHLVIAAHIAHWLVAGRTVTPVEPSEAMAFSKAGVVNAGLIFFGATILLTAVFGRFFCGWACHLVALQDLCRWLLGKVGIRPKPLGSRLLALVPLGAFVYMFLWPVAWRLWTGDSFRHGGWELTTSEFWATFPGWVIGGLTFLVCGFAIVYFLGAKGFCFYACPYGAIFGAAEKLSPMRIRVTDACAGCGHCTAVCSSNVRVHEEVRDYGMVVDSGCMKCLDCVSVCPNDALYYGAGPLPLLAKPRAEKPAPRRPALGWGQEGVLAAGFLAAFFSFRGLYGQVPFLMSLGLAAVLAWLCLQGVEVIRRPNFAWRRRRLKAGGRLLPAGAVFLAVLALVLAFWAHSGWVRYHAWRGESAYAAVLAGESGPETVSRAIGHLETVRDHGLFPTVGNSSRLAWLYQLASRPGAMRAEARRALALGEDYGEEVATMHRLLASDAAGRGDVAAAVASYQAAIVAEPGREDDYVRLGTLLAESGDLAAAEEVFDRGRQQMPSSAVLAYNAGLVRAFTGRADAAVGLFREALALDPAYREARENLAGLLAQLGRFDESIREFRLALEAAPDDLETRRLLVRALLAAGYEEPAREQLAEVLRRAPGDGEARALLAELTGGE